MGASNALRVYTVWGRPGPGGRPPLGNRAIRLMAYMALRSVDGDAEPWCAVGHRDLATIGLGMDLDPDDQKKADAVLRKVRRFVGQLTEAGAITMTRRATYGVRGEVPAKYRLNLDGRPPSPPGN